MCLYHSWTTRRLRKRQKNADSLSADSDMMKQLWLIF